MSSEEATRKLKEAIVALNEEEAKKATEEIITSGIGIKDAIERGITEAAKIIGDKFEKGEYFLGELLIAADIITEALDKLVSALPESAKMEKLGKVVIATVYGDIHDIGKNLLAQLLKIYGFEVYDLGKDVPSIQIVNKAVETNADIIALSALMTTTMPSQKEVIDMLKELGKRDKFKVIIGGGSTSPEWAKEIGADGWGETAWDGVELAIKLVRGET
jgi:trimethylamine corrinoid protein